MDKANPSQKATSGFSLTLEKRMLKLFLVLLGLTLYVRKTVWNCTTGQCICYLLTHKILSLRGAIKRKDTLRRDNAAVMNRYSLSFDALKTNFLCWFMGHSKLTQSTGWHDTSNSDNNLATESLWIICICKCFNSTDAMRGNDSLSRY